MKFKKEWLQDLVSEDLDDVEIIEEKDVEIIEEKIEYTSRWSTHYSLVFKYQGKYYRTYYSRGATEMQCEQPYEYDKEEIEVDEVIPVPETIIVYKKFKTDN